MAPSISNKAVAPKSAWTMLCEHSEYQSQTRQPLHLANHPSFPLHLGLNALAGEAGAGKTQLCLTLVKDAVLLDKQAVYVSLGKDTTVRSSQRLHSMIKHCKLKQQPPQTKDIDASIKQDYLTNIFVNWVRNPDDLMHLLYHGLPKLLDEHDSISLVVLDGMANLFRINEENNNGTKKYQWAERSAKFFQIASQAQRLSFYHKVPFLCTNQATSKLSSSALLGSQLEPALGLSWAQCINASYFVRKQSTQKRILKCIKSSHMSTIPTAEFAIEHQGVVRIE